MVKCRHCGTELRAQFLDLGSAPPSNAYLPPARLREPETWYPLRLLVCESCWLVQTEDYAGRDTLFTGEYAYFSSYSSSWLAHAERYVEAMIAQLGLGPSSTVVEVAANDGYLLQYVQAAGVPCYGVEPTASTAREARRRGIEIVGEFFGQALARDLAEAGRRADLIVANNVLAHVPDINDFVAGFPLLLHPQGVATFEFPHLLNMVRQNQFDIAYHEHFSYLSLTAVERIFSANGLRVFDVEELATQGGSLRVYAQRQDTGRIHRSERVDAWLACESDAGMRSQEFYIGFQAVAERVKDDVMLFLLKAKRARQSIAAYGAAAKGNTLLNFAGVRPDLLPYVVDKNPAKQGKYMPGSHIPICSPQKIQETRPDFVLVLPWNIADEIVRDNSAVKTWGGKFVTVIPGLRIQ